MDSPIARKPLPALDADLQAYITAFAAQANPAGLAVLSVEAFASWCTEIQKLCAMLNETDVPRYHDFGCPADPCHCGAAGKIAHWQRAIAELGYPPEGQGDGQ